MASVSELMRAATNRHKAGDHEGALAAYRVVQAACPSTTACPADLFVAALLLGAPNSTPLDHREAHQLAAAAFASATREADSLPSSVGVDDHPTANSCRRELAKRFRRELAKRFARHGYFLLLAAGAVSHDANDDDDGAHPTTSSSRPPDAALASLRRATALDGSLPLAWRNLSLAHRLRGEHEASEAAAARAVEAGGGNGTAPIELLYTHGKCLRKLRRNSDAAGRFCDVLARDPCDALAVFWLRVLLAGTPPISPPTRQHVVEALQRCAPATTGADTGTTSPPLVVPVVPHVYISRLFDGYAKHFEQHLVSSLQYRTPQSLLSLALRCCAGAEAGAVDAAPQAPAQPAALSTPAVTAAAAAGGVGTGRVLAPPSAAARLWRRGADLGCGTGLAGALFRPSISGELLGCDLSPNMVAEARARVRGEPASSASSAGAAPHAPAPVFDDVAVGDIVSWMRNHGGFDLVVCADVLVYIGDLRGVFEALGEATVPGALVLLSTEAQTSVGDEGGEEGEGFRLSATGRCTHARVYVERTAARCGFHLAGHVREAIRRNLGADVIGDLFAFRRNRPS